MSLIELTLEGEINKINIAVERLRYFEPPEGYYLAFSGGKDSITLYELAKMAQVKFDTHFNFTSVDPPELLKFIRENYSDVIWERPKKNMFKLIANESMPPTALARYCCDHLKERCEKGMGRFVLTGIRRDESIRRKKREMFEFCIRYRTKKYLHPIIDWTEKEVWEFIKLRNLKYCCLYDEGYKRIGCIMCPMQTLRGKLRDKKRYPNFYKAYLLAFKKMLKKRKPSKYKNWNTPEEVMHWWIYERSKIKQDTLF